MTIAAEMRERMAVLSETLSWLGASGTPYHHGAQIKGVGVDCAHLLAAVYGGLRLVDVGDIPQYSPDWFLHGKTDMLREFIARYCVMVESPQIGDIALYRYGRFASHAGIIIATDPLDIVHAFRGRGVVREEAGPKTPLGVRLDSYWTLMRWADE